MKKLITMIMILLTVTLISCSGQNFNKVKKGMKSTEVIALVGQPKEIRSMWVVKWWMYNDSKKHIIIMQGDSVINSITKAEFEKGFFEAGKFLDSISKQK